CSCHFALLPVLGTILPAEYEGVAGPPGGSAETDCASATAAVPANTPRLRTVDLSKLDIAASSRSWFDTTRGCPNSFLHANDNCASHSCSHCIFSPEPVPPSRRPAVSPRSSSPMWRDTRG